MKIHPEIRPDAMNSYMRKRDVLSSPSGLRIFAAIGLLCLIGCSDRPTVRARYEAERALFAAEKRFESLRIRPELNSPEEIQETQRIYRELVGQTTAARAELIAAGQDQSDFDFRQLSDISYRAATRLSQFYFSDRKYDSAALLLRPFVQEIPIADADRIVAAYNVGRAFQSAARWDDAALSFRAMYELIEKSYVPIDSAIRRGAPLFESAYRVLVTFAEVSKQFNTPNPFTLQESIEFYQRMIRTNPTSRLALIGRAHIAQLYEVNEEWQFAIMALGEVVDTSGAPSLAAQLRIADIEATSLGKLDDALARYTRLETGLVGTDTLLIPDLRYRRAAVLINKKAYDQASAQLVEIERNYPAFYQNYPAAQQAKARVFELQGNRDRAESEYRFLIENFPNSGEAMATFLHLAEIYKTSGDTSTAREWYDKATRHYEQAAARGSGTGLEALALNYRAELYRQLEDWPRAATALEDIFRRFPDEQLGREAMVKAAAVYGMRLNDTIKANLLLDQLRRQMSPVDASQ
jgi:tetratricopeptide (TPR) repeat protein